jgi:hypothetical protein
VDKSLSTPASETARLKAIPEDHTIGDRQGIQGIRSAVDLETIRVGIVVCIRVVRIGLLGIDVAV